MAGHRKFSELRDKMTAAQSERSNARLKEMQAEMLLAELRKHSGLTQQEVAKTHGNSQPGLSKMESQTDMTSAILSEIFSRLAPNNKCVAAENC